MRHAAPACSTPHAAHSLQARCTQARSTQAHSTCHTSHSTLHWACTTSHPPLLLLQPVAWWVSVESNLDDVARFELNIELVAATLASPPPCSDRFCVDPEDPHRRWRDAPDTPPPPPAVTIRGVSLSAGAAVGIVAGVMLVLAICCCACYNRFCSNDEDSRKALPPEPAKVVAMPKMRAAQPTLGRRAQDMLDQDVSSIRQPLQQRSSTSHARTASRSSGRSRTVRA